MRKEESLLKNQSIARSDPRVVARIGVQVPRSEKMFSLSIGVALVTLRQEESVAKEEITFVKSIYRSQ